MKARGKTRSIAAAVLLLAAGCRSAPPEVANPLDCFPPDARRWIRVDAPAAAQGAQAQAGTATIYVDRSGSMTGYLAGATAGERPLHDLIGNLPAMLSRQGLGSRYRAFGTQIGAPLGEGEQAALMRPEFYACAGEYAANCDNNETHLNRLFEEIARDRAAPAVVITDLWFSNSDVQTSALSSLAGPLTEILASGRAVAVYGIPAPFNGRIYDVPFQAGPVPFQGEHPLFAIAIGTNEQIARFHDAWKDAPSPYLRDGLAGSRIKRTLFTLTPTMGTAPAAEPLSAGAAPGLMPAPVLESRENLRIQQYELDVEGALRQAGAGAAAAGAPPNWTGPSAAAFAPDSVWQGTFRPRARVWERRGNQCADGDWLEGANIEGLWRPSGSQHQFVLAPEAAAAELARSGTYLIAAEIERTGLQTPNPASAWMRDWSLAATDTSAARQGEDGTAFFPTLHLGEFARLMEGALGDAARRDPRPIFGFAFVVRAQR